MFGILNAHEPMKHCRFFQRLNKNKHKVTHNNHINEQSELKTVQEDVQKREIDLYATQNDQNQLQNK